MELIDQYETLLQKLLASPKNLEFTHYEEFYLIISQLYKQKASFIIEQLQTDKYDLYFLDKMILLSDSIRAAGVLYEPNITFINKLLKVGLDIYHHVNLNKSSSAKFLYYVRTIFDIIFHQIDVSKESENIKSDEKTRSQYIELVMIILDSKNQYLFQKLDAFNQVVYFILMNIWDNAYQEEFLLLWNSILPYLEDYGWDDPICESWLFYYDELQGRNQV